MEHLLELLCNKKIDDTTLGVIFIDKKSCREKCTTEFSAVMLFIVNSVKKADLEHYDINNMAFQLQFVQKDDINRIFINGSDRRLISWIINGTVLYEKEEYLTRLRKNVIEFPISERKYKMTVEFSKLIRSYTDGNKLFYSGHFLDAFNSILHSLHHLARLSVIEHGFYPEVTVWKQVKLIEPEVYKLYEEMVTGEESLEKRLELLLLANNFALTSKTKIGSSHLLETLQSAKKPMSIGELLNYNGVKEYAVDLNVLIDYLVQKGLIDIVKVETEDVCMYERLYYVR